MMSDITTEMLNLELVKSIENAKIRLIIHFF